MNKENTILESWAPIEGRWEFEPGKASYLRPSDPERQFPIGIALSNNSLRSGSVETKLRFLEKPDDVSGHILFGYRPQTGEYFSAGIGAFRRAYTISEFVPTRGWTALGAAGSEANLSAEGTYSIRMQLIGQRATLLVDGIKVVQVNLPRPLSGDQIGLYAWGNVPIEFIDTTVITQKPKVFVVMQFGEPYDAVYTDVIKPVVEEAGLEAYRVDDVYRPGIILQDIIQGIVESELIVAEITPPNPNVFYELGFAHALDKPTILLADRQKELPFDIRSYRCIFYDNTIKGKKAVEDTLRKHLASILDEF